MTRKHFNAIAADFNRQWEAIPHRWRDPECIATARTTLRGAAESMAYTFSQFNPQFDRKRFLEACGCGEG